MKKSFKKRLLVFGIITLVFLILIFANSINLNPLYPQSLFFYCFMVTVYAVAWLILKLDSFSLNKLLNKEVNFHTAAMQQSKLRIKIVAGVVIGLWVIYFGVQIYSMPIFHASRYRDQLTAPVDKEFTTDVQALDIGKIPVVDSEYAYNLADKKLGETPSLGSQVVLGEPVIQRYNEELVWIVPLYHSGFFKWLTNMDGTPGYIKVSATNFRDVEYIKDFKIKYQPGAYLLDKLDRHVRFSGALFNGTTDMSFEIDDTGMPYWVVTSYKNTCGFDLPEATGVYLVNAQDGDTQWYAIDNVPGWVDRVQPEKFIVNQINNRGEYINGFWNFSDKDKFRASAGESIIYNNGRCYLFTGITSIGGDNSTMGFMMVDMVTKETINFRIAGATEGAAQQSAEQKIAHLNYRASFPIILNLDSVPTYFMTLKDADGLVKQYAFVSVKEYSILGVDETIEKALENYRRSLSTSGSADLQPDDSQPSQTEQLEGTVERIASEVIENQTVYRLLLSEKTAYVFTADASLSSELSLTQPGDKVKIAYVPSDTPVVKLSSFDNLVFPTSLPQGGETSDASQAA